MKSGNGGDVGGSVTWVVSQQTELEDISAHKFDVCMRRPTMRSARYTTHQQLDRDNRILKIRIS